MSASRYVTPSDRTGKPATGRYGAGKGYLRMRSMLTTLLLADAVHKYSEDQPRAANGEFGEGGESTPKVGDSKPWGEYAWIAGMNRGLGGKK